MCNITFQVLRLGLSTFVFNKCSEKVIFTIIFVVKSLKGFGWNNVGPASQMVAQHYLTIGPMYRVIWVVAYLATGDESVTRIAIAAVLCRKVGLCIQNAGLLLGHPQTSRINIEATLVSRSLAAVDASVEESCVGSVLE